MPEATSARRKRYAMRAGTDASSVTAKATSTRTPIPPASASTTFPTSSRGRSTTSRRAAVRKRPTTRGGNVALDPTTTDPDKYKVIFENDRVRVLEYRDKPGDRTSPHEHPDSVMYTLSSFERRLI